MNSEDIHKLAVSTIRVGLWGVRDEELRALARHVQLPRPSLAECEAVRERILELCKTNQAWDGERIQHSRAKARRRWPALTPEVVEGIRERYGKGLPSNPEKYGISQIVFSNIGQGRFWGWCLEEDQGG